MTARAWRQDDSITIEESGQFIKHYKAGEAIVYFAARLEFAAYLSPWKQLIISPGAMKFSVVALDDEVVRS